MSIKNVKKQPGPVGAGLVPVQSGQGRSVSVVAGLGRSGPVSVGAGDGTDSPRCRSVPEPLTGRKKRCKFDSNLKV
jgi:hypothetical protein